MWWHIKQWDNRLMDKTVECWAQNETLSYSGGGGENAGVKV